MNELVVKIEKDVDYMENTHVNDPNIDFILDEIERLLVKDSKVTIEVLKELNLLSIEWISSTFEKISYELQSKELVECLDGLLEKFSPNVNGFKNEVQEAREAFNG
ncbi:hypothetical protein [Tenacibaculum agarivorans]|uniref:hypothetical protein n=1 Tax=Tenacibaculum agarivorans TaxID=1908389 RepID=UPI00094B82AF|nr:hypothetical protein [Tenacibaculum agarivorans]